MFTLVKLCGSCDTPGGWNTDAIRVASMLVVGLSRRIRGSISADISPATCGSVFPGRAPASNCLWASLIRSHP